MNNEIVWGTCWYNESVETVISFFKESIRSLEKIGFKVTPIVFDARFNHNYDDIKLIKKEIKNIKIILNKLDVFPNKNYGINLITNMAYELNIEYIAIIDPDWNISDNNILVKDVLTNLIYENGDILIPDIGDASGRSNILLGRTAVKLFYPEYFDVLKSPFPGAVIAKTDKLYDIVNDDNYHFDWGGEWDIISIAIKKNMKIVSSCVSVVGVRHRTNTSKMQDSFQIWKAILSNDDIIERYKNIGKYELNCEGNRYYNLISKNDSIVNIINIISNNKPSKTELQILYMILYPVALIMGELKSIPIVLDGGSNPYDKSELYNIADFAVYCLRMVLLNSNINDINEKAKKITGKYFSKWDNYDRNEALKEYGEY